MDRVYPAIFHLNNDGTYTITFPDFEGCISEGKTLGNALYMAQSALTQWLEYLVDEEMEIPVASKISDIITNENEFVNLVCTDIKDNRAVRRNISIPRWMDKKANEAGLSLSRILQEALSKRLM